MKYEGKIFRLKNDPTYYIIVVTETDSLVTVYPISFDFVKATPDDILVNVELDLVNSPIPAMAIIMLDLIAEFGKRNIELYFEKAGELVTDILPYINLFINGKIDLDHIPYRGSGYGIPSKKKFKEEQTDLYIKYLLSMCLNDLKEIEGRV